MSRILLEIACPKHGFERLSIKVIKRYNIPSKDIIPLLSRKLKPSRVSRLYVGRNVTEKEIKRFIVDYLSKEGTWKMVLNMKLLNEIARY